MSYGAASPKRSSPQDSKIHRLSSLRPALEGVNRDGVAPDLRPFAEISIEAQQRTQSLRWGAHHVWPATPIVCHSPG